MPFPCNLYLQVPLFENMDERLLDAICERLKPCLYTENTYIVREGDPVDEMLFIIRGRLESVTTDGGRSGFFNRGLLKEGDFCGEELLTWALDPKSGANLPSSTRTVKALTEVEAFALIAEELKFVASQFRRLHSRQVQHTFRFYSQQWRTWAAECNFDVLVVGSAISGSCEISYFGCYWKVGLVSFEVSASTLISSKMHSLTLPICDLPSFGGHNLRSPFPNS